MAYLKEYFQPWKLITYCAGLGLLLAGAFLLHFDDWDTGISLVMSLLAYTLSPIFMKKMLELSTLNAINFAKNLVLSLFIAWFVVDGSYWAYWSLVNPQALYMRAYQWPLSTFLFLGCAALWHVPGPFINTFTWYKNLLLKYSKK